MMKMILRMKAKKRRRVMAVMKRRVVTVMKRRVMAVMKLRKRRLWRTEGRLGCPRSEAWCPG